ncbi:hypothetical protein D1J63_01660 [Streptomyces sp. KPB2]|uniref:hypothetical protein n=1 Tax=Streptomyces sp. KPB2 TaxID=2305221 RepID=UPI000F6F80BB|nr:hypothetical protein [Streptomyces sp. KPB2]AZM73796.1 hypothetical protein D1J63_01660 [Streptomyces sp. KPB2]
MSMSVRCGAVRGGAGRCGAVRCGLEYAVARGLAGLLARPRNALNGSRTSGLFPRPPRRSP